MPQVQCSYGGERHRVPLLCGGYQTKQLGLANKYRPIEYGFLGRSTQMTGPGSSPLESHDGRPDSSATLIGAYDTGLLPTTSASGSLATMYGALTRVGEVGRQASHNSDPLPSDAAPQIITVTPVAALVSAINSPPSSMPPQLGSSSGAVLSFSSTPIAGHGFERQSAWSEKTYTRDASSSSGATHSNDGQFPGLDDGSPGSSPIVPEPITGELTIVLPAYMI
ncbi:hypothetical protein F5888DRAFT_1823826 [Russula emetica]|nr:hypothetical protein F5888DRAFT_1823826 [Russula emetica]